MNSLDERHLDRLITGLYDAAMAPGLWAEWLSSAAEIFGGFSGLSVVQDRRTGSVDFLSAHNMRPNTLQLYNEYYHRHDLWAQRAARTLMKATVSDDLCTDEEFANSEIYVDLSTRHADGQFYVVGAVLPVDGNVGIIGFQNPRAAGPFSRLHARALDRLLPHLQRALVIRGKLSRAEAHRSLSESALDELRHGVLLVTVAAGVVFANVTARTILQRADGLSLSPKGVLRAALSTETTSLHALIAGCRNRTGGGVLSLSRPSGHRALEVIVAPLPGSPMAQVPVQSAAIVFVRDPEDKLQPIPQVLASLHRLTPAEARLAADLLEQRILSEIADRRRIGRETLRSQLKSLFAKTGTNRQSELIGFLAAGLATAVRDREPR